MVVAHYFIGECGRRARERFDARSFFGALVGAVHQEPFVVFERLRFFSRERKFLHDRARHHLPAHRDGGREYRDPALQNRKTGTRTSEVDEERGGFVLAPARDRPRDRTGLDLEREKTYPRRRKCPDVCLGQFAREHGDPDLLSATLDGTMDYVKIIYRRRRRDRHPPFELKFNHPEYLFVTGIFGDVHAEDVRRFLGKRRVRAIYPLERPLGPYESVRKP